MTIRVSGRNTSVKDSFKNSLEKKLAKLERFFEDDVVANVTVSNENGRETVEVTIKANSLNFRSEKTAKDRLDALDSVVDSLFRQIVKNKTKLEKRMRNAAFDFELGSDKEWVGSEDHYNVVRVKRFNVKPMDVDEAILQMNLIGHNFFMFRNSETDEINVVYKRNDGNYGVLEPEA